MKAIRVLLVMVAFVMFLGGAAMLSGCATASSAAEKGPSAGYAPSPDEKIPGSLGARAQAPASRGGLFGGGAGNVADVVAPQSLPSQEEELWIIEKRAPVEERGPAKGEQEPGSGVLVAKRATELVPVPLKHTDVKANIAGYIATVDVTQQFHNPYQEKIEAVYVFPLPHNAAVNEFVMTVGERKIRGIIREREEAQRIYNEARRQGYVASLLTQERPNIFTQSVANIEPGKEIEINVKYFHTLSYVDGWYEYVFPMVVGPRFNPPGMSEGVGAVERGGRGVSGQSTEVQYLRPHERSGHDIALSVQIDAGVAIEEVECKTHRIEEKGVGDVFAAEGKRGRGRLFSLTDAKSIPNRDFVLRYKVAGGTIKSALMVQRNAEGTGGWFTVMLYPPESLRELPRKPLEMVFTIDVSGSQSGVPLAQEKAAVKWALLHMGAEDTFQVIRFGDHAIPLFAKPQAADAGNVRKAMEWIDGFDAREGTMLVEGLRASLLFPHDESRLRFVTFLTDGFIGNEAEALAELHNDLGRSRIFSFGSGSSTNRYLLEHMAKMGNGCAAYLGPRDDAAEVMARFFERISHPAMTDVTIDYGGLAVTDVYPQRVGDLFVGRPVVVTGRFSGGGEHVIRINGNIAGERREIPVTVNFDDAASSHAGIAAVWARMKIADLADRAAYEEVAELPRQIKAVALEYGLMSSFTAFVAVDSMSRTAGDHGTTVAVPVPVPEGVRYETTVTPKDGAGEVGEGR